MNVFFVFHLHSCLPQDWQRKLSQLVPEQQKLTEKLRNISLNKLPCGWQTSCSHSTIQYTDTLSGPEFPHLSLTFDLCLVAVTLTSLTGSVAEKGVNCRRLKDQLDTLERETTDKLSQMEQYNKELKVSGRHRADLGYGGCGWPFSPVSEELWPFEFSPTQISPGRVRSGRCTVVQTTDLGCLSI